MKVNTRQESSFADEWINLPATELDGINQLIDWTSIESLLTPVKGDYEPLHLLKALLLQTWYNLSDKRLSDSLNRDLIFMRFCSFSLSGRKPDQGTLCRFRNKLIKQNLWQRILQHINTSLETRQLKINQGQYVSSDATLISSAHRPRKVYDSHEDETGTHQVSADPEYSDDVEATWVKKGKKVVYGYAGYFTTDSSGLVEAVDVTPAHVSEMSHFRDWLDKADLSEGTRVLYDKGASSALNREALKSRGLRDGIMRKKPKGRPFNPWQRLRNKAISRRRFVVERTFGTLKRVYGLSRSRYIGMEKVLGEALIKSIAYNLKRAYGLSQQMQFTG